MEKKQSNQLQKLIESMSDNELHELLNEVERRLKAMGSIFDVSSALTAKSAEFCSKTTDAYKRHNPNK